MFRMKIIIVGCGRNGSGLALTLSRSGHDVTVIDSDESAFLKLGPDFKGRTIEGMGIDREILLKAQIERTDALGTFTSSDEANAAIARIAREIYHVPKVVARLYDQEKAEIYRHLGIQTLSSVAWGIKRASDLLTYMPLEAVYSFGNGEVELVKVPVPSLIIGKKIRDITVMGDIHVVAMERGNKTLLPMDGTICQHGDILYIAVTVSESRHLKKMLGCIT